MPVMTSESLNSIAFTLNGERVSGHVEPRLLLSDFLRQHLGATGTHVGCEHGVCGACTVLVDNEPARACLMLAVQANERTLTTVEGLADNQELTSLQQAFKTHFALQCGYCTPGILVSLHRWLQDHKTPTEQDVREMLSGHLCRCTGYSNIVQAVMAVVISQAAAEQPTQTDQTDA